MTDTELTAIIELLRSAGTDHRAVEAKSAEKGTPTRLWETVSAFANSLGGGVIILGLDERKNFLATGVHQIKQAQGELSSICSQMQPEIRAQIAIHKFEGKALIVAEIPEVSRDQKPCFYKGAGQLNGSFIRVGDGDHRLASYEIQMLLASRGQPRDDEEAVPEASLNDLDPTLIKGLANNVRRKSNNLASSNDIEILRSHRAIILQDGRTIPTIAGILALGKRPQTFFPSLCATFVVYPSAEAGKPGPGGERFLDDRRLEGPINLLLDGLLTAIRHHMARKTLILGSRREDVWDYPEIALREAISNALVHRDLSTESRGTPIQVQMFPDRLVIVNPGGLFGPVNVSNLGLTGNSAARNATLMRLLEDAPGLRDEPPVCENRGSGMGAMLSALRSAGMEFPDFKDTIASFRLTFSSASLLDSKTLEWLATLPLDGLSHHQRIALALLKNGKPLDNSHFRQVTGLDSRVATTELGDLVERGLIVQVGSGRWTTYSLKIAKRHHRDVKSEILNLLKNGPLSRPEIEKVLSIPSSTSRVHLLALRENQDIELTGPARSPAVKYRLALKRKKRQK